MSMVLYLFILLTQRENVGSVKLRSGKLFCPFVCIIVYNSFHTATNLVCFKHSGIFVLVNLYIAGMYCGLLQFYKKESTIFSECRTIECNISCNGTRQCRHQPKPRRHAHFIHLFYLYVYPPDLQKCDGGANTQGLQLPRPNSADAKILLFG